MSKFDKPLAEILRPTKLDNFIGQSHLVGENGPIRKAIQNKNIYSMIFWGPPGCGKTTLARIIAKELNVDFVEISPVTSGVKDIKAVIEKIKLARGDHPKTAQQDMFAADPRFNKTILFVDEIHRFNKAQQDYLLPHVENGTIVLIGATTENPSFEVVSPLLSRSRVYVFEPIKKSDIVALIDRAVGYLNGEGVNLEITDAAKDMLAEISNGDARTTLNSLDAAIMLGLTKIDKDDLKNVLQDRFNRYDKKGDEHYNTISAFIKSMRASQPNAALYYLARMVNAGEDPLFIARRMVIFASEDIGLADPVALQIANAVFRACETIGYPECQINLAHGVSYLANAPKSRNSYDAYFAALDDVKKHGNLEIPLEIRNAPTKLMKDLGYGKSYEMYPQDGNYLPKGIKGEYFRK